jgi:3-hydroxyacyl-CoA dehydrogenase
MSEIQSACLSHPERCIIGHPFNPPHLVPLVEVVGGAITAPRAIRQAMSFYRSIGKRPVHLRREVVGHVANRLQAALQREIIYLIGQGIPNLARMALIAHNEWLENIVADTSDEPYPVKVMNNKPSR